DAFFNELNVCLGGDFRSEQREAEPSECGRGIYPNRMVSDRRRRNIKRSADCQRKGTRGGTELQAHGEKSGRTRGISLRSRINSRLAGAITARGHSRALERLHKRN